MPELEGPDHRAMTDAHASEVRFGADGYNHDISTATISPLARDRNVSMDLRPPVMPPEVSLAG